jgi:hypothetical protein
MKPVTAIIGALFTLTLTLTLPLTVHANSGPIETAVQSALNGPEKKKIKIFDHEFNIKQVEIIREGDRIIASGQISHVLRFRRDDQVYYRIIKEGDKIIEVSRDINRGGFAGVAAPILAAGGSYFTGTPIPPDEVEKVFRALGNAVDGSWESAADFIISSIALRLK